MRQPSSGDDKHGERLAAKRRVLKKYPRARCGFRNDGCYAIYDHGFTYGTCIGWGSSYDRAWESAARRLK